MNAAQVCAAPVGAAMLTLTLVLGAVNAHGKDLVPSAPPFHGQVIDVDTQRPLAGALVMVVGRGYGSRSFSMGSGHRRLWRFAVRADADGRFATPAWTWSKGQPIGFIHWGLDFTAYVPGYDVADPQKVLTRAPIERARTLGLFPADEFAPGQPVRILLRRLDSNTPDARARALALTLNVYQSDWDADRPGDALVYEALGNEARQLRASPELSSAHDRSLNQNLDQLRLDIEGWSPPPPPRQTSRGKRANGEITETPAR
jgi:hypothetical protein